MRLTVIGCAGSFPSPDSAASSYLVQADDERGRTWSVLLDLGNGALGPLQRVIDPRTLDAIALSHLHADHVADTVVLYVLLRYHPDGRSAPIPLHGPAGTPERLLSLAGAESSHVLEQYDVHEWDPAAPVRVGPLTLTPVPVHHPVTAYGIRVSGPAEDDPARTVTLGFSGDTDECAGVDEIADADLFLCEAAYVQGRDDEIRGVHLTGRRAGEAAARGGSRALLLTHLPAWNDPRVVLAEAREEYAGPVALAVPGGVHLL
ncbi:MBL fold metallo-hydrolase [Cellulomonas sp. HZM]|uniref:MBL fold metallo-hydrolase n=1 Tax=Cellulomonas sp. HZM TaxID=1454010 RepID=UPI00049363B3|nr:MBL fold metallo-hydrolase [Cellulomonas sp. HZM]